MPVPVCTASSAFRSAVSIRAMARSIASGVGCT